MSRLCDVVWLAINGIGTLLCLSAAVVFMIYKNHPASVWSIIACILAACNTYIRAVHFANKLEFWYSLKSIANIRDFGMCLCIIFLGFFSFALFEFFYYNEKLDADIPKNKIIVVVWCFISAKYAFTLFWVGRNYMYYLSGTRNLLEESQD